jgi:hypothetical protein
VDENSIANQQVYGLNAFTLKVIALFCMTLNHGWHVFGEYLPLSMQLLMNFAGGFTFPIMAFLLAHGYARTSSVRKYMARLLAWGAVALLPFMAMTDAYLLNVMFTLFLGLLVLWLNDCIKKRILFYLCLAAAMGVSVFCDWPVFGVLMIYLFGVLKNRTLRAILPPLLCAALYLLWERLVSGSPIISMQGVTLGTVYNLGVVCAAPLLLAYNTRRGPSLKRFFYAYYPAHLIVLTLAAHLLRIP